MGWEFIYGVRNAILGLGANRCVGLEGSLLSNVGDEAGACVWRIMCLDFATLAVGENVVGY